MSEEKAQLLLSPFNSSRFRGQKEVQLTDLPYKAQSVVKQVFKRNEKDLLIIRQAFWKSFWHHIALFSFSLLMSGWMVYLSFTTKFTPVKDPEIVIFWTYNFAYGIWLIVQNFLARRAFVMLTNKRFIMFDGGNEISRIPYSDIIEVTYRVNCCGRDIYIRYDDEPRTIRLITVASPEWVINEINFMRRQHWDDPANSRNGSVVLNNNDISGPDVEDIDLI